jgi:hypothetical protein
MSLDSITPQELNALERGIRKLRQDQEQQRDQAKKLPPGPTCWTGHIFVQTRRNGQNSMARSCDCLADAFEIARDRAIEYRLPVILVDSDQDFRQMSAAHGDGVYIIEQVSEVWGPPIRRPAPWGPLRNRPPLDQYFAAREARPALRKSRFQNPG